jgi:tetratricopeptide (TPR) repeat protein
VGEIYMALGDQAGAVRSFEKATAQQGAPVESYIQLALHYGKSDPQKAVDVLRRGDTEIPGDPSLLFTLAYSYQAIGRMDEAIQVYDRILRGAGDTAEPRLKAAFFITYGAACEQAGEFDRAVDIFEQCIALYPDEHEALNYVAYMWADKGVELEKALGYAQRALAIEPANGAYIDTLAWVYYRMQRYTEALEQIQKAAELIEDDPTILDHLGDIRKAAGDPAGAVQAWTRSFARDGSQTAVSEKLRANGVNPDEIPAAEAKGAADRE